MKTATDLYQGGQTLDSTVAPGADVQYNILFLLEALWSIVPEKDALLSKVTYLCHKTDVLIFFLYKSAGSSLENQIICNNIIPFITRYILIPVEKVDLLSPDIQSLKNTYEMYR